MNTNFETLNDINLHEATVAAAGAEKSATLYLLECLHWVEKRRTFLERGHASLFAYVQKGLGYSGEQASERVRAMRLAYAVPEVKAEIETGAMTLTAAARLATHVKRTKLSRAKVTELIPLAVTQSTRELERELIARETQAGFTPREICKPISATHTEVRVSLTQDAARLLEEARDLDANPGAAISEILEKALKVYVAEKRRQKTGELVRAPRLKVSEPVGKSRRRTRYIQRATRRIVHQRAQGKCQYTDPHTGHICDSKRAPTIEHRTPFAYEGSNTPENLALYCAAHNAHTARRVFGERMP